MAGKKYTTSNGGEQAPKTPLEEGEEAAKEAAYQIVSKKTRFNHDENSAVNFIRRFAHSQGLVVLSPIYLVGQELTGFGDSDQMIEGELSHRLVDLGGFTKLYIPKGYYDELQRVIPILHGGEWLNREDDWATPSKIDKLPPLSDERGRWPLLTAKRKVCGIVVRVGEGPTKRYLAHLWEKENWTLWGNRPFPYDLPLFGITEVRDDSLPVMVHEGPRARDGAIAAAADPEHPLCDFLKKHVHVAWHGAASGIDTTDWSPLKGHRVVVWPDMDAAGLKVAETVCRTIARLGNVVETYAWSNQWCDDHAAWDLADKPFPGLSEAGIREYRREIEVPFNAKGHVLMSFASRTAINIERRELLIASRNYEPLPYESVNTKFGRGAFAAIQEHVREAREVHGSAFLPGIPYGEVVDGRVNRCRPSPRDSIPPARLPRSLLHPLLRFLHGLVPDPAERAHVIRRLAWAVARPARPPHHAVVFQGQSGIGKSLLMELLVAVVGADRADTVFPNAIFGNFNNTIHDKQVIGLHEIHGGDVNIKQGANRLKEMIGNKKLSLTRKNKDDYNAVNTIHWFMATNEQKPFVLSDGNDRFYFVKATFPSADSPRATKRKAEWQSFISSHYDKWFSPPVLDQLHSAARYFVDSWKGEHDQAMAGRVSRQKKWTELENISFLGWQQEVLHRLDELELEEPKNEKYEGFWLTDLYNLVKKSAPMIGVADLQLFLSQRGYRSAKRMRVNGQRGHVWLRKSDHDRYVSRLALSTQNRHPPIAAPIITPKLF